MIEIRFHGRAGQGAKSASELLAQSALIEDKFFQSFPEYGAERMGAPMKAFFRISDTQIRSNEPIVSPDIVVVLDDTIINTLNVTDGLKKNGFLLINTKKTKADIQKITGYCGKIYLIDATKITVDLLCENLPNIPLLGALIKIKEVVKLDSIKESILKMFQKKIGEEKTNKNILALMQGFEAIK